MEHGSATQFLECSDLLGETRVAGLDAGGVPDNGFSLRQEAEDGGGHGNPVVAVAVDLGPDERTTAFDQQSVRFFLHRDSEKAEILCDHGEAIAFLVAKFRGVADFRRSLREGRGDGENGDFVDQVGDFLSCHLGGFQAVASNDGDGAEGFRGGLFHFFHDACPHPEKGGDEGRPGGVESDVAEGEFRAGETGCENHPKGGGGEITRHIQLGALETLGAVEDDRFVFIPEAGPEGGEEAFRVVTGEGGFGEDGFPGGLQGGEQNAGFDLSTGDLAGEVDCPEIVSTKGEWGTVSRALTNQFGTELAQRFGNPFHGTTGEGGVSEQTGGEREACDDAGEEADGGATVPAVDRFGGREEFACPALDQDLVRRDTIDATTQRLHGVEGREAVFPGEKSAKPGGAGGETAEHDSPMGNAFVPRDGELRIEFADGADFQPAHGVGSVRRTCAASSKSFVRAVASPFSSAVVRRAREVPNVFREARISERFPRRISDQREAGPPAMRVVSR